MNCLRVMAMAGRPLHHRFERLSKKANTRLGCCSTVKHCADLAPRGESSGYITFPLEPMTTVVGRPMLGALQMLLGLTGCSAAAAINDCRSC